MLEGPLEILEKNAPLSSATTSTPTEQPADPREWDTVRKIAAVIGVVPRSLELRLTAGKWPALERKKGCVSAWAAFDHFCRYGSRRPYGLREPAWPRPGASVESPPAGSGAAEIRGDLSDLDVKTLLLATLPGGNLEHQDKERLVKVVLALLRKQDSEERKLAKISREDVIKMHRSLGELYCATIEAEANARAAMVLQTVREQFAVDLAKINAGALAILAAAECRFSNDHELKAIKQAVLNNVDGVEILEGVV